MQHLCLSNSNWFHIGLLRSKVKWQAVCSYIVHKVLTFRIRFQFDRNSKCLIRTMWWKCVCVSLCIYAYNIKVVRWRTCRLMSSRTVNSSLNIYICVCVLLWAMLWGVHSPKPYCLTFELSNLKIALSL